MEGESGQELGILNDVSLTVEDYKLVVITGPNGGGKTTLAKAIMGLVQPTGGSILWNGADITQMDITGRARLGISYGFQQPPRFKGLKVKDLLALAAGSFFLSGRWLAAATAALGAVLVVPAYLYSYFIYKSSGED